MALAIAVLAGCMSPMTYSTALLRVPSGGDASTPEFRVGLSGLCVAAADGGSPKCLARFPNKFDLRPAASGDNGTALVIIGPDEYRNPAHNDALAHPNPVQKLATAMGALLVLSTFLGAISIGVSLMQKSGFNRWALLVATPDLIILAGCGTMAYFVVTGYPVTWGQPKFATGATLLYVAIAARFFSQPVFIAVLGGLLAICCGPNRRTVYYKTRYVNRP
jgi:hypothetical protein